MSDQPGKLSREELNKLRPRSTNAFFEVHLPEPKLRALCDMALASLDQQDEIAKWQDASQCGHPNPCTLGPLCPYCEIARLKAEREYAPPLGSKEMESLKAKYTSAYELCKEFDVYGTGGDVSSCIREMKQRIQELQPLPSDAKRPERPFFKATERLTNVIKGMSKYADKLERHCDSLESALSAKDSQAAKLVEALERAEKVSHCLQGLHFENGEPMSLVASIQVAKDMHLEITQALRAYRLGKEC